MIYTLRFITTPIFVISYLYYLLIAFPWMDGKSVAWTSVMKWQMNELEEEEEDEE